MKRKYWEWNEDKSTIRVLAENREDAIEKILGAVEVNIRQKKHGIRRA